MAECPGFMGHEVGGGGTEGLWGGRNEAGETRSKLRCAPDSGPERQVRRNGFPVKAHFSTWL